MSLCLNLLALACTLAVWCLAVARLLAPPIHRARCSPHAAAPSSCCRSRRILDHLVDEAVSNRRFDASLIVRRMVPGSFDAEYPRVADADQCHIVGVQVSLRAVGGAYLREAGRDSGMSLAWGPNGIWVGKNRRRRAAACGAAPALGKKPCHILSWCCGGAGAGGSRPAARQRHRHAALQPVRRAAVPGNQWGAGGGGS